MVDVRNSTDHPAPLSDSASLGELPPISAPGSGPWIQFNQPFGFEWHRVTLPITGLAEGLVGYRILHVSDFHFRGKWSRVYEQLHERIAKNPPGLLLVGGDYVENKHDYTPSLEHVRRLLRGFTYRDGCFGVLGNHDGAVGPQIDGHNIKLIDRQRLLLEVDRGQIELIGLPRLGRNIGPDQPFIDALPPKTPGVPRVILSHYSDYLYRTPKAEPDLFLAGHTHGGQICLPGMIPVLKHTSLPRRLAKGIHRVGNTWLVANRGMGFSRLGLRLFCPSEVVEIELARAAPL